ncbi:sigma-54-dependent Fis family transcriptional regulator [Rubrivivax gelatinosus]|uniref:Transcriptional regulator of acetoin/glycerol metabolism n=1 Tax=Rubrivivax gelatinosus TaxID=28068 RepID=A0A4R2M6K5_RUBGE|nr:sigma-54-dependent Fis family transcriptional regulator [Rubrivivax gelatinosus]MBK1689173.1 phytochrome sensor protein [Rubrivivax gelatinosus]TCO97975.1 transcriptional regulator of acetoin/glycerol metabolism [Rubrivivax gelatinosus]
MQQDLCTADPALARRAAALGADGDPDALILQSWARCAAAGLQAGAAVQVPVVDGAELARRRERAGGVRRLALAQMEALVPQIAGSNFLLAFADADGVILDLRTDSRFRMDDGDGIVAGSRWQEADAGTNGLGTALASGQAVAVTGGEHFFERLGRISCTAAPVHDVDGSLAGVLDASSYVAARQRHTLALVRIAAVQMENALLRQRMRGRWVVALATRPEFLGTANEGLLAFDEAGRLLAANARAAQLLHGATAPGAAGEALLGERWEALAARWRQDGAAPLRAHGGTTLHAAAVARPPQPRLAPRSVAPAVAAAPGVVADDPAVADAFRLVEAAVRMKAPILIQGETGCGKELLARHAHVASGRRGHFVAVNCGALPEGLLEAELFGHVGGAYTGARRDGSVGLVASADGGTLLLDEIGELPLSQQAALLRFLDDGLVRPVGGTASRRVDVQLLAATHVPLAEAVAARRFRADLLYRLDTVRVELPPLRRREDFAAAVRSVLATLDGASRIDDEAVARLARHDWPGNFRELRSLLTRALLRRGGGRLALADVEPLLPPLAPAAGSALQQEASERVRRVFERSGNVSRTARELGISRTTVYRHLRAPQAR